MTLDKATKDFVVNTSLTSSQRIIKLINDHLVVQLNKHAEHSARRFDDIDKRLEQIEARLEIMNKDTKIIPDIFTILEVDGRDIAELATRVDKLDS